jgi:hypothetical protein
MSEERRPTTKEINDVRNELRDKGLIKVGSRKNDHRGIRPTHVELLKRGFKVSLTTVQRVLKIADKPKRGGNPFAPVITRDDVQLDDPSLVSVMAKLLEEANTSTVLAIRENRVRMSLNIVIAERMAASPGLLLLDMKGAAALVDALTTAAKLSNGAAVDVKLPTTTAAMRDITPAAKTALQTDIEKWREKRGNGATPA